MTKKHLIYILTFGTPRVTFEKRQPQNLYLLFHAIDKTATFLGKLGIHRIETPTSLSHYFEH